MRCTPKKNFTLLTPKKKFWWRKNATYAKKIAQLTPKNKRDLQPRSLLEPRPSSSMGRRGQMGGGGHCAPPLAPPPPATALCPPRQDEHGEPQGDPLGTRFSFLRTAPRDHQPPNHQPPPTVNRHQPPPTASGDQPPTANHHQPPTAMVEHMSRAPGGGYNRS